VYSAGFYHEYLSDAPSFVCTVCTTGSWCPGQRAIISGTPARLTASRIPAQRHAKTVFVQDRSLRLTKSVLTVRWTPFVFVSVRTNKRQHHHCPGDNNKYACPGHSAAPERSQALSDYICDGGFEKM
jgi:hypothetical protein